MVGPEGRRLLAQGREAELYEWDHGRVLRLLRDPGRHDRVERSRAASEAARRAGVAVPRSHELVEVDGRPGEVLDRVDGPDMFAVLGRRPYRLFSLGLALGRVQAGINAVEAPVELESTHDRFRRSIGGSALVPEDVRTLALAVLDGCPDGDALCHGDYHPGNVLVTEQGAVVIDWPGATRGDPTADFARTRMMLRVGELAPGSPPLVVAAEKVGRGVFGRCYERGYRRAAPVDDSRLDAWVVVNAANRLTEDVPGERDALLALCAEPTA